jgi:acetylornithine deacetylase/succinyl-diaminopimelate desuccinylase-like protein
MMTTIDIFYQGEGVQEIEHIEFGADGSFGALKAILAERHGFETDLLIFLEDTDEPIDEIILVREHVGPSGVKVHVHRCRHIEVATTFNGETVHHKFAPAATIARVKRWAAEHKFGMTAEEASEHVLQISGSHNRPAPGTHLGALPHSTKCQLAFDLVPDERVNG